MGPVAQKSQIKTMKISPIVDADVVRLYKDANEAHPATTVVKSQEAAGSWRAVVDMDIKFMVGCNQAWVFPDDDEGPAGAAAAGPVVAGPPLAALQPGQQQRSTTPLPLLPRLRTQVTSPSGICSMPLSFPCLAKTILQTTSGHCGLRMRGFSFASCPRRLRLRFRIRLKHSMRGSKNLISILRQSTMCATIGQSVAMHTAQWRFGGSYQCTIF
jgi:hypothetical protein